MNSFIFHPPAKILENKIIEQMPVAIYDPSNNTNEQNQFPNDTIRVKVQPAVYTEDCIAAGCREDMW